MAWFPHDGHPLTSLAEYLQAHSPPATNDHMDAQQIRLSAGAQSLLTFGLLEAVLERPISESILIKPGENGEPVMDRNDLDSILAAWIRQVRQTERTAAQSWLERAQKNMTQAHSLVLGYMRTKFWVFQPLGDDLPAMMCFIALIGETLVNAMRAFPPDLPRKSFQWSMVWAPLFGEKLAADMVAEGWCPSIVDYLFGTTSVSALEYAAQCGPIEDGRRHGECTKSSCESYTVDPDTYVPRHVVGCEAAKDSCPLVGPLLEDVKRLVLANEVPVVEVLEKPNGIVALQVRSSSETPFVAISHVWADGLGSTTEQGLPACQLRRLVTLVRGMYPGAAFWTDGLCIPDIPTVRKKAIGMMGRIYSEAVGVLVLDGGLQLCPSVEPTSTKILHVLTCGWMRRLWTLQEAVLAKDLVFAFSNKQIKLNDLIPLTSELLVQPCLGDLASELFRLTKRSLHSFYSIGDVSRSLRWRTTSRPSDETLAIASLLGSNVSNLVDLSAEDRMKRMLLDIAKFPRNILFLRGAKLKASGFRWAPQSFMASSGAGGGVQLATSGTDAVLLNDGLKGVYYAITFSKTTFTSGEVWQLNDSQAGRQYEVNDSNGTEGTYTCDMLLLLESVTIGGAVPCVAVRQLSHSVGEDGGFTVYCEYRRRMALYSLVSKKDTPLCNIVEVNLSGKLTICLS